MRKIVCVLLFIPFSLFSQQEKFPVFGECRGVAIAQIEACFYTQLKAAFYKEFKAPSILAVDKFKGTVNVVFLLMTKGTSGLFL